MLNRRITIWLLLAAVGLFVGIRCSSDKGTGTGPPDSGLEPGNVTLEASASQQFEVDFDGVIAVEAMWYVDGVLGGSPETGMITPEGLYVAPADIPSGVSVTVMARAVSDPATEATAKVTVERDAGTSYVEVTPDATTAAAYDSVEFSLDVSGCSFDDPAWSMEVISGGSLRLGEIRPDGTYMVPTSPTGDFELMVMVKSTSCPDKTGIAKVTVKQPVFFNVELEDFNVSKGTGISGGVSCGGGVGIQGLDAAGEWIGIPVTVPAGGRFVGSIRYAAGYLDELHLTVAAEGCGPDGTEPTTTFVLDQGSGVGG